MVAPLLDYHQPLLAQIQRLNRNEYNQVITEFHITPHLANTVPVSLPLFSNPFMERLSRTPWYIVPLFWLPIVILGLYYAYYITVVIDFGTTSSSSASSSPWETIGKPYIFKVFGWMYHNTVADSSSSSAAKYVSSFGRISVPYFRLVTIDDFFSVYTFSFFLMGMYIWSLLEYVLHRFMFHSETWIPERYLYLSFLFHGIHHLHPLDANRLVMPPSVSLPLTVLFSFVFRTVFSPTVLSLPLYIISFMGGIFGYVCYDMIHYSTHHISLRNAKLVPYFSSLQLRHMKHHIDSNHSYGVSNMFWDKLFGTTDKTFSSSVYTKKDTTSMNKDNNNSSSKNVSSAMIDSLVVPDLLPEKNTHGGNTKTTAVDTRISRRKQCHE